MKVEVNGKVYDYGDRYYDPDRANLRKTPPAMRRAFNVSEMNDLHHQICRMLAFGMKNVQIAKELGITAQTVANVKNSPICKKQVSMLRGEQDKEAGNAVERIKKLADQAVTVLEDTLYGQGDGKGASIELKNRAAINVLGMNGIAAVKNVNVKSAHLHLGKEDLEEITNRAAKLGITPEKVLDQL
jgi:hypothetical protein